MPRRFIDLSVALKPGIASDPPGHEPKIAYLDHAEGAREIERMTGIPAAHLPDGEGWAIERCEMSTHTGTHLDAPWHYHSTMNHDERAATIDEIPLDWCFRPGVKLDFRAKPDGYVCTAADVEQELARIGHTLQPLDIVLVNTAAGTRYGEADYIMRGCGMGRGDALSDDARRARDRHGRLELGRAVRRDHAEDPRHRQRRAVLGRPQGGARYRLLPHREAVEPGEPARHRLHGVVLPGEDRKGVGRLVPGGRDLRRIAPAGAAPCRRPPAATTASRPQDAVDRRDDQHGQKRR